MFHRKSDSSFLESALRLVVVNLAYTSPFKGKEGTIYMYHSKVMPSMNFIVSEFCDRLFRNLSDLSVQFYLTGCYVGKSNETPESAIKFESLEFAPEETTRHQRGLEASTVCSRSGSVFKNDKVKANLSSLT
jgi:hypothetical protein